MEIPNVWAPLLVSAVRDAVLFQEQLLKSETIRNRADYEEHHLQLTQFLEFIKEEYKEIETEIGMPLERLL
ncbi:MAG: hypothetical protein B0W54_20205 [Cellvibrio sp. 79]|jgi:hypothetical protein|nr:MAG: hypothetical protein B0W54_20205 [Cellvibrio sp. 79]